MVNQVVNQVFLSHKTICSKQAEALARAWTKPCRALEFSGRRISITGRTLGMKFIDSWQTPNVSSCCTRSPNWTGHGVFMRLADS
jgi:hypothetical protein